MKNLFLINSFLVLSAVVFSGVAFAQKSTRIQGNTEINASSNNTTAVAVGENVVAKNRVGVVQGEKKGNTRINVSTSNVTTVVTGRNKKACTNIGAIVSDECK
ncbi:MAG TPA: hypothetical protein PLS67_03595 [Accumulibacter sp.]|jgi:hypothetical protein|nr:hypothetical protein [Accumulibacter sp.]HQC79592.1 hypothetical protein [Accumulibacter sp.]